MSIFLKNLILKVLPVLWRYGVQEFLTQSFFVHFVSLSALGMLIRSRTTHTHSHMHAHTYTYKYSLGVSSKVQKQPRSVTFPNSSLSIICLEFPVPWSSLFSTSNQKSGALIHSACTSTTSRAKWQEDRKKTKTKNWLHLLGF